MVFSSYSFLFLFLPAVLFVYYALLRRRESRNLFLLAASLAFYAYGEPSFVVAMMASILVNWLCALAIGRAGAGRGAKLFFFLAVLFDVGLLFTFKYLAFFLRSLNTFFDCRFPVPRILLPIGISFFTFQALSYVTDVYRSSKSESVVCPAQRNPFHVGLYIALFPQLIAGPIVRYSDFAGQILGRRESLSGFSEGVRRFIGGLAKKVLLADNLALVAGYAFGAENPAVLTAWLGAAAYTLQIFYDFSGYSDMAVGLGKMFGFTLPENFNYPYLAKSASEFWRRWHISLGAWFRDYVYIPLGGGRVSSKGRLLLNLFAVWSLTGLWHGANWTFVLWGLMFFVLIALEKLFSLEKRLGAWGHLYTLFFVLFGWVFFRSPDLASGLRYAGTMFGFGGAEFWEPATLFWFREHWAFFLFGLLFAVPVMPRLAERFGTGKAAPFLSAAAQCLLLLLSVACLVGSRYSPFIYFHF